MLCAQVLSCEPFSFSISFSHKQWESERENEQFFYSSNFTLSMTSIHSLSILHGICLNYISIRVCVRLDLCMKVKTVVCGWNVWFGLVWSHFLVVDFFYKKNRIECYPWQRRLHQTKYHVSHSITGKWTGCYYVECWSLSHILLLLWLLMLLLLLWLRWWLQLLQLLLLAVCNVIVIIF